jgi:beta-glucanase (GH16 family)
MIYVIYMIFVIISIFSNMRLLISVVFILTFAWACQPKVNPFHPDGRVSEPEKGWKLVWNDEFNKEGIPDSTKWNYERGFVRNKELQYYQKANAACKNGLLVIEGKRERVRNEAYQAGASDWRQSREFGEYTSACLITKGRAHWRYGRFEIRARIDTCMGLWPAIWTLGIQKEWPDNGEVDIMEYYRYKGHPTILANAAWGSAEKWKAVWNTQTHALETITKRDKNWTGKFHLWRMDWNENSISIYLDDKLLSFTDLTKTLNSDGFNPFRQPAYLLLNLAIGELGGDPSHTKFPVKYEIDYVRIFQGL